MKFSRWCIYYAKCVGWKQRNKVVAVRNAENAAVIVRDSFVLPAYKFSSIASNYDWEDILLSIYNKRKSLDKSMNLSFLHARPYYCMIIGNGDQK